MKPTLLVLAAGMGSRYGGLKQLDHFGPSGETILEYSVYDAIRAGFGKVVFVIRKELESAFREQLGSKFEDKIDVRYAYQQLDDLPAGFSVPEGRTKPWGTGQAVWAARELINEPFGIINADDFYGPSALKELGDFLSSIDLGAAPMPLTMVGYRLENTLSENGTVSRGVCEVEASGNLESITERTKIARSAAGDIRYFDDSEEGVVLPARTIVSMNLFGLVPKMMEELTKQFTQFLQERGHEQKSEFYIPMAVSTAVQEGRAVLKVLTTDEQWFGVTYPEDKVIFEKAVNERVAAGVYPDNLWKQPCFS